VRGVLTSDSSSATRVVFTSNSSSATNKIVVFRLVSFRYLTKSYNVHYLFNQSGDTRINTPTCDYLHGDLHVTYDVTAFADQTCAMNHVDRMQ